MTTMMKEQCVLKNNYTSRNVRWKTVGFTGRVIFAPKCKFLKVYTKFGWETKLLKRGMP